MTGGSRHLNDALVGGGGGEVGEDPGVLLDRLVVGGGGDLDCGPVSCVGRPLRLPVEEGEPLHRVVAAGPPAHLVVVRTGQTMQLRTVEAQVEGTTVELHEAPAGAHQVGGGAGVVAEVLVVAPEEG